MGIERIMRDAMMVTRRMEMAAAALAKLNPSTNAKSLSMRWMEKEVIANP